MTAYTVRYTNQQAVQTDACFYATNAYDARLTAMELIPWVHDHPNCITHILNENDHFDW